VCFPWDSCGRSSVEALPHPNLINAMKPGTGAELGFRSIRGNRT